MVAAANNFGQYLAKVRADEKGVSVADYVANAKTGIGIFGESTVADDEIDFQDYMGVPTPSELHRIYNAGFKGAHGQMPARFGALPTFYSLFPWAKDIGKGKICLPYLAVLAFVPEFGTLEAQTRGSCVSHGTRAGGMGDYCSDALIGETTFKGLFCTENIYRARGYNSCGANCGDLALYVSKEGSGGFLVRGKYGDVDLTTFSSSTEAWAARGSSGVPADMDGIAAQNKSLNAFRCESPDEERDAHALGFGTNGCSGLGFSSTTDAFGLAERSGSWAHSMGRLGTIDTAWAHSKYGGSTCCKIQSWGKWNTQKGTPEGVKLMPGGAFFIRNKLFGSFSVYGFADVVGFGRSYGDYCDYLVERAKSLQEFTQKCYDDPATLPQPA